MNENEQLKTSNSFLGAYRPEKRKGGTTLASTMSDDRYEYTKYTMNFPPLCLLTVISILDTNGTIEARPSYRDVVTGVAMLRVDVDFNFPAEVGPDRRPLEEG